MQNIFKVLSVVLSYPGDDMAAGVPQLIEAVNRDPLLSGSQRRALAGLIEQFRAGDLYDLQERYVQLFDRGRTLSLHLFEHVHGESRDRGQAMVDLMQHYERHGLKITARELPDYLPLFLEYLALLEPVEARRMLGEPVHIIAVLARRHRQRKTAYAVVFEILESLAHGTAAEEVVKELLAEKDDDPDDLDALDRAWEEAAVTFGPEPGSGCASAPARQPAGRAVRVDPPVS